MADKPDKPLNMHAAENNYWQHREFDFDEGDRQAILPHESYGKYYTSEMLRQPGNDWESATPQFIAECTHKQEHPLFAIKWMKDGKKVATSSCAGQIIVWDAQQLSF